MSPADKMVISLVARLPSNAALTYDQFPKSIWACFYLEDDSILLTAQWMTGNKNIDCFGRHQLLPLLFS
jgi:hypothetical protein